MRSISDTSGKFTSVNQEVVVAVLAFDEKHSEQLAKLVEHKHFDPYHREIVKEIAKYKKQYKQAPGDHLIEIIENLKERQPDRSVPYDHLRESLFENKDVNAQFVLSQVNDFIFGQESLADLQKLIPLLKKPGGASFAEASELMQQMAARKPGTAAVATGVIATDLSKLKRKRVQWLLDQKIPLGKLTLFSGDPGLGKSTVAMSLIAQLTNPRCTSWMDGSPCPNGSAIIVGDEDGVADTLLPRLLAMHGRPGRVRVIEGIRLPGRKSQRGFAVADIEYLEEVIEQLGDCKIVVIDPISGHLGKVNAWKDDEVRGALGPLAKLAERRRCAILMVSHLSKNGSGKAIYRSMGSIAFAAAARVGWCFVQDKADRDLTLMLPVKNNLAPRQKGFTYRIDESGIRWEGESDEDVNEYIAGGHEPVRLNEAKEWLAEQLAAGPVKVTRLEKRAVRDGLKWPTIFKASKELGILKRRVDPSDVRSPYIWRLPD